MADHEADPEPQPLDEEAAWAAIVAGYGEEPADPPGARPFKSVDDLASLDSKSGGADQGAAPGPDTGGADSARRAETTETAAGTENAGTSGSTDHTDSTDSTDSTDGSGSGAAAGPGAVPQRPLGGSVVFPPGMELPSPAGPRDHRPPEDDDEGHFVPPEPPPLPESDATARFAWLGAVGGPVLALLAVIFQWDMTWWLTTLCAGGFLGGIAALVARMKPDDEDGDGDDPGRGAVV
ncbi:hypothetical protein AB0910_26010 [Streptomyces sp. NPDC047002]|uniref:hypothetical protein n=1 Tax=Streptomyces sp. NPDC047002 TaxID=3155475 RepID=UPI0034530E5F